MLNCKQISELASRALDEKLTLRQRMSLRMHLLLCSMCRGFARNLRRIQDACSQERSRLSDDSANAETSISPEARDRLRKNIEKAARNGSSSTSSSE